MMTKSYCPIAILSIIPPIPPNGYSPAGTIPERGGRPLHFREHTQEVNIRQLIEMCDQIGPEEIKLVYHYWGIKARVHLKLQLITRNPARNRRGHIRNAEMVTAILILMGISRRLWWAG